MTYPPAAIGACRCRWTISSSTADRSHGISGGRACTFQTLGDGAVRWVGGGGAGSACAGRGTLCVYGSGELLAYSTADFACTARLPMQLETPLVASGAFVAAGHKVYRASDLALQFDCGSSVLAWQGIQSSARPDSIPCGRKKLAASYSIDSSFVLFTEGQDFYELSGRHPLQHQKPARRRGVRSAGHQPRDGRRLRRPGRCATTAARAIWTVKPRTAARSFSAGGAHTLLVVGAWGVLARRRTSPSRLR